MSVSRVLSSHGLSNVDVIVQAAGQADVPIWIAAALIEKESGGRNVYGNDRGGVYWTGDRARPDPNIVTPQNYARFEERVLAGETSNGVGPAQITWPGFIRDAKDRGIRLWDPLDNIRYGLTLIAGYLGGLTTAEAVEAAGLRYNGAPEYGADLATRAQQWRARIEGAPEVAVIATTNIGWAVVKPQLSGAKRPGPHTPTPGNGREIGFRDSDVADLLAGAMWLTHTGNAGKLPDEDIYLWHGSRSLSASFGSDRSDHKAQAAMDQNWPDHPWEEEIGQAAYDKHMDDRKHAPAHKLYRAVQARLTPPGGGRPVVRWCGEAWTLPNGAGYPVGFRDCMHWAIETQDNARIKAAVAHLHSFFVPPRAKNEIGELQDIIGASRDNQWGPKAKKAMRAFERELGVPRTGLPGSVAFWQAYRALFDSTYSTFLPRDIKAAQKLLAKAGFYTDKIDHLPGPNFRKAMRRAQTTLASAGLYPGTIDDRPGPLFMAALTKHLKHPAPAPAPTPAPTPVAPVERISGASRFEVFAKARETDLPKGPGLLLAADGSADLQAAILMAARRPDVDLQITDSRGALHGVTLGHIAKTRPGWVRAVGGTSTVPDATVRAAIAAAKS